MGSKRWSMVIDFEASKEDLCNLALRRAVPGENQGIRGFRDGEKLFTSDIRELPRGKETRKKPRKSQTVGIVGEIPRQALNVHGPSRRSTAPLINGLTRQGRKLVSGFVERIVIPTSSNFKVA